MATDAAMAARIREAAANIIDTHRIPGISIGVVQGDDLVFCEGFGVADLETKEPMSPERRQRIASITKTMVGLTVMAAVDDEKLRLDDRVTDLLPELRFEGPVETMTVRHLLTHTSGIGEAPTIARLRDVANPDRQAIEQPGDFSTLYPDGVIVEAAPGSKYAYCNNGYGMLGEIIQRTEGADLQDVMHRRIWEPLGMTSTDILDENDDRITSCYHRAPDEDRRFQLERAGVPLKEEPTVDGLNIKGKFTADFNRAMRGAGGVQSTVPDMAKYASALLRQGAGIVKPATFAAMTSDQHGGDSRLVSWGLSMARTPLRIDGERPSQWKQLIGHGGAYFGGWNSHLDVIPELGIGIIQHMNIMLDEPAPLFRKVIRAALGAEAPRPEQRAVDPQILATAPGMYMLPMPGPLTNFRPMTNVGYVNITVDGDRLMLESRWGKWKTPVALTPCDPDDRSFFAILTPGADPAYLAFDRDAGGNVVGLRRDELVVMHKRPM